MIDGGFRLRASTERVHLSGVVHARARVTLIAALGLALACGSSGSEPPDPLAEAYCADCSVFPGCPNVVNSALNAGCPDLTRAYYACLTDNACDTTICTPEWDERQACLFPPREEDPPASPND